MMKSSILFQSAVGLVLAFAVATQAFSLYKHLHPRAATVTKSADSKTCEPRTVSGVTDDGRQLCDFETVLTLQPWPRLCGCPEFCESPCR